jgi:hypothetical protein
VQFVQTASGDRQLKQDRNPILLLNDRRHPFLKTTRTYAYLKARVQRFGTVPQIAKSKEESPWRALNSAGAEVSLS